MKRIKSAPRVLPRSHSSVVAKLLAPQVEHYGDRATRNFTSRLSATGIRALLYQAHMGGDPCVCGITGPQVLLDDDGHLTPDGMTEIVTRVHGKDRGVEVFDASDMDKAEYGTDEDDLDHSDLDVIDLIGREEVRCGVCFNTGWIGGYGLANGQRICLPVHTARTDHQVVKSDSPWVGEGGTYAEWDVTLLFGREFIYRLWEQDQVVGLIEPSVMPQQGRTGLIRFAINQRFSHIEILSRDSTIPVDVATVNLDDNTGSLPEIVFQVPSLYQVPLFSLIADTRYNAFWMVKQVVHVRDNAHRIMFQEATCRQVKPNEIHRKLIGASK